jgi:predicted enzyme related to lactoylglutathione lyase
MTDTQGNFVWYELMTSDVKGASDFYKHVIGWGTQLFNDSYLMWTASGTPIGGVMSLDDAPEGTPPHWMAHVTADDVDALAKKALSLGAKTIVAPTDIPTVGRFSIIADPQGAVLSLFTPSGPPMTRPDEAPNGHFSWHELMANDPEAAFRFYSQLLGWEKTEAVTSPMGVYQMYGKGGRTFGGMMKRPTDFPAPPHWLYYVKVSDLDGALERVKYGGGQVMNGPMEVPGGARVAQCMDPQRAAFALHGR